jgi:hypothetical protein
MKEKVSFEGNNYLGVIFNMHASTMVLHQGPTEKNNILKENGANQGPYLTIFTTPNEKLFENVNARGYMLLHVCPIRIN